MLLMPSVAEETVLARGATAVQVVDILLFTEGSVSLLTVSVQTL